MGPVQAYLTLDTLKLFIMQKAGVMEVLKSSSKEFDLEEYEKKVALTCQEKHLTLAQTRSSIWIPFADTVLADMEKDVGVNAFFLPMIEKAMVKEEMYERTNFPIELLLRGVIIKHSIFNWPRYRTAAILYAPF